MPHHLEILNIGDPRFSSFPPPVPGESALKWPGREGKREKVKRFCFCFDEGTDDNDAEWEYCTKLKLLVHVNVFIY